MLLLLKLLRFTLRLFVKMVLLPVRLVGRVFGMDHDTQRALIGAVVISLLIGWLIGLGFIAKVGVAVVLLVGISHFTSNSQPVPRGSSLGDGTTEASTGDSASGGENGHLASVRERNKSRIEMSRDGRHFSSDPTATDVGSSPVEPATTRSESTSPQSETTEVVGTSEPDVTERTSNGENETEQIDVKRPLERYSSRLTAAESETRAIAISDLAEAVAEGEVPPEAAVDAFRTRLEVDDDTDVKLAAMDALGRTRAEAAAEVVSRYRADPETAVSRRATEILRENEFNGSVGNRAIDRHR
jgi:hypothetical protein